MYNIREIKKALRLLSKYDYAYTKVSRELGIPITTLRMWRNKEINNKPLLNKTRNKKKNGLIMKLMQFLIIISNMEKMLKKRL